MTNEPIILKCWDAVDGLVMLHNCSGASISSHFDLFLLKLPLTDVIRFI